MSTKHRRQQIRRNRAWQAVSTWGDARERFACVCRVIRRRGATR